MTDYLDAPDVREIGERLRADHHAHALGPDVRVEYVFRDTAAKTGGRQVWAKVRKISGLNAYLASPHGTSEPFFVLEVAEETWEQMPDPMREALIDHHLSSMGVDHDDAGTPILTVLDPPAGDWPDVIRRHGLWRASLRDLAEAAVEQLSLLTPPDGVDAATGEVRHLATVG
jgi:hypothetical protein